MDDAIPSQAFRHSLRDRYYTAGVSQKWSVNPSQGEERVASEHEPAARRQSHRHRRQVIIPGGVRVNYLHVVCTHKTGETYQVLHVVAPAQREGVFFGQERQFGPQGGAGDRRCVDFMAEISQSVREIC
jgi:hypothetical protein